MLAWMLAPLLAAAVAAPRATLCVESVCGPVGAETLRVPAAQVSRHFVWIAPDASRIVAGTIPAGAEVVALEEAVVHTLTIRLSDAPAAVTMELKSEREAWTWMLAAAPSKQFQLWGAAGIKTLTLRAKGYRTVEKKLSTNAALGTLWLHRLPVIRGIVVDEKSAAPVAGAAVALPSGDLGATTDRNGRFAIDIEGAWPALLRVSAPGRATHSVEVPKTVADTDLRIAVRQGGSLRITLLPPLAGSDERLSWQLRRGGKSGSETAREGAFNAGQNEISVTGLEAGAYRLIIRGQEGLQQFGMPLVIRDEEMAEAKVAIRPAVLEIDVRQSGAPLAGATVEIEHMLAGWLGHLIADSNGHAAGEIWQLGDLSAHVSLPPRIEQWSKEVTLSGDGHVQLLLEVPDHRVHGRVVDHITGGTVAEARVFLQSRSTEGDRLMQSVVTKGDGAFEFGGIGEGEQRLTIVRQGYRTDRDWRFTIGESDGVVERDLVIDPITGGRVLFALSSRGVPLPSAAVIVITRDGPRDAGMTDDNGTLRLAASDDDRGLAFVVPASGSFGWTRFAAAEGGDGSVTVKVPDGVGALDILTRSTDGEVVPHVGILMRVDGMLVPIEVLQALSRVQGVPLQSGQDGRAQYPHLPPGQYELWPVLNRDDFRSVYSPTPPPAPVSVTVTPGTQSVLLKFAAKGPG